MVPSMAEHEVVIRNGTVVDGTGAPPRRSDVALARGVVTHVGVVDGVGQREIDADGLLVTPGFVDVHTHYDGQATWDNRLAPSSWHGVTTVITGNCGVGFAPVFEHHRQRLIELMEGVEDIPGTALHEGLQWNWTTFGEFLDAVDAKPHDIDLGCQIPHNALRLHVMGERGADHEVRASADDIAAMGVLVAQAVRDGAMGFSTSRTRNHRSSKGEFIPSLTAAREELVGIAAALNGVGGVLQVVSDFAPDVDDELETLRQMVAVSGRPLSMSLLQAVPGEGYLRLLRGLEAMEADGHEVRAQVAARAVGVLVGLQATMSPFARCASFAEVADSPLAERVRLLSEPERRARILAEHDARPPSMFASTHGYARLFPLGDPPDYEPAAHHSVAARAVALGCTAVELAYDMHLSDEGTALLYIPVLNYGDGNLDAARRMLTHPLAIPGLSDGGAHVGTICDASFPTTLLTHWCRDRSRGDLLDVSFVVHAQCRRTAQAVGLHDRGLLAPGYRADINIIDFEALTLHPPRIAHDLPAQGRRLLQRVDGYRHTFVAGVETYTDGQPTGALPGRLVRGAQPSPV